MPVLHVEVNLTVDDLIRAVQRLEDEDFERFQAALAWVVSRREKVRTLQELPPDSPPAQT